MTLLAAPPKPVDPVYPTSPPGPGPLPGPHKATARPDDMPLPPTSPAPPPPPRPTPGVRPRLLDLFSCAGGAAAGYHRAGFDVVGVDINPQPRYPFEHHVGDALEFLAAHGHEFDAVHASPPCQEACALTVGTNRSRGWGGEHVQLIPALRELLNATGLPYVIEQPNGTAPVRKDVTLCGETFGLGVLRHRNFELGGWTALRPTHRQHRGRVRGWRHGVYRDGPYVAAYGAGGGKATVAEMQTAMGIGWTDVREELTEAIPPAYTAWLGSLLMDHVRSAAVAR